MLAEVKAHRLDSFASNLEALQRLFEIEGDP
jgi:hypothetical protein